MSKNSLKRLSTAKQNNTRIRCNPFNHLKPSSLESLLKEHVKDLPDDVRAMIEEALDYAHVVSGKSDSA